MSTNQAQSSKSEMTYDDQRAKKNVGVLIFAQGTMGAQMPMVFVMGGLCGQILAENKCWATLPISVIVFGSMLFSPLIASFMQAYGRAKGFALGALGGALGAAVCAYALFLGSFEVFLLGSFLTGSYMAAQSFYRFAAVDTASPEFRPKAISYTLAGGLVAAVLGPQLVNLTEWSFSATQFAGAYIAIVVLNLVGVWIFKMLDIPLPAKASADEDKGRSRLAMLKTPRILVAMICAMVSYSLMNLVMTSTPLAVVGVGFETNHASHVVMVHVLAMFIPSFFTGHLIAKFGAERIIALGLFILLGAGLVGLSGINLHHFFIALALLGLGWNFGFIGATAMLASAHTPQERGRLQGMNDFAVFGMVTLGSLSSGLLMNCSGGTAIQGWSAVNYAMVPFLLLASGALIWLAVDVRRQKKAA
ncbi:MAG: MFS transporter [Alphaproteobacteria bacterium]